MPCLIICHPTPFQADHPLNSKVMSICIVLQQKLQLKQKRTFSRLRVRRCSALPGAVALLLAEVAGGWGCSACPSSDSRSLSNPSTACIGDVICVESVGQRSTINLLFQFGGLCNALQSRLYHFVNLQYANLQYLKLPAGLQT